LHVVDLFTQFPQTTLKANALSTKVQQFTEVVAHAPVKRKRSFTLPICNQLHEKENSFRSSQRGGAGHSIAYQPKDHDIRSQIHDKGIGSRQSPFVLDYWISPVRRGNAPLRELGVTDA
jgi:hypothetical protein